MSDPPGDTFELAPDPEGEPLPSVSHAADAITPIDPSQPQPVLPYRRSGPLDATNIDAVDFNFPSRKRDLYAPVFLFLLAILLTAGRLLKDSSNAGSTIVLLGAFTIVKLTMMLVCIPVATRLADASFGTLASAVAKFGAIAMLPDAMFLWMVELFPSCITWVAGPIMRFLLCWSLFGLLFDLDPIESRTCAIIYWFIGVVFAGCWFGLFNFLLRLAW